MLLIQKWKYICELIEENSQKAATLNFQFVNFFKEFS